MPVGEIICVAIEELFGYIIIDGIEKLFRSVYYGVRKLINGKEREIPN